MPMLSKVGATSLLKVFQSLKKKSLLCKRHFKLKLLCFSEKYQMLGSCVTHKNDNFRNYKDL